MALDGWIKIAPLLSFGVAIISAVVAFSAYIYTRRANRRRATLDMVMRTFLDDDGRKRYDLFKDLMRRDQDQNDPFKMISLKKLTADNGADRSIVLAQLNNYELVSLGIRRGVFAENFYKRWFHRQFTKDYENMSSFISAIQEETPTIFCEFQYLYTRWMKKKHPESSPSRIKMAWWAITRNYKKLDTARRAMEA